MPKFNQKTPPDANWQPTQLDTATQNPSYATKTVRPSQANNNQNGLEDLKRQDATHGKPYGLRK